MIAKQERSRKRVKIILNTARDILAESSVDEITIANIAKRADLKRTSTYKFFPSPEKIKMMIIEDDLEQCAKDLALNCENNSSDNLKNPLEIIIIELIKLLKESLSLQKLVLASNITPPLTISSLDLLSSVIEDYIEKNYNLPNMFNKKGVFLVTTQIIISVLSLNFKMNNTINNVGKNEAIRASLAYLLSCTASEN